MIEAASPDNKRFPVTWTNPEGERLSWWHERWHLPDPISPLAFDYAHMLYDNMNRGRRAKGEEGALRAERVNTYVYVGFGPSRPDDHEPIGSEVQPDRFQNHATWDTLWLPEIRSYLDRWQAFPRDTATAEELLRHIDQSVTWLERCWEIHDRLEFGPQELFTLVTDVLGWTQEAASDLVLGSESKSLEGDDALRDLARLAIGTPAVRQAFLDLPPGEVLDVLETLPEAEPFQSRFQSYLEEFGRRSDNFHDIGIPTWSEDPSSPLALVKLYVREPAYDAAVSRGIALEKRSVAQQRARTEFAERAPDRLDELERDLAYALRANSLNEDHNYWLDQQVMYWARRDMLVAGTHLAAAGVIEHRDDVFMLTLPQVRAALAAPTGDLRPAVQLSRDELDRWTDFHPPGQLGAPMPPELSSMIATLFGQLESTSTETQVRGLGAAAGVVTGVARIIASLEDSHRLGEGEILVTQTTSPPWTPLFGIAAAVVTDAGGPMSHVAIVAREYGIPAVVGTVSATRQIEDGQLIRVDGSEGTVDLLRDD